MLVDIGNKPTNPNATFTVIASIYSDKERDYIKTWEGETFPHNFEDAFEFWDTWEPPKSEIDELMSYRRKILNDTSHHELEISIKSDDIYEESTLAFMNTTLDGANER